MIEKLSTHFMPLNLQKINLFEENLCEIGLIKICEHHSAYSMSSCDAQNWLIKWGEY